MIILSEETEFKVEAPFLGKWLGKWVLWRESGHIPSGRLGLVVLAGARVVFEPFHVTDSYAGIITVGAGLPEISSDGLDVVVKFRSISDSRFSSTVTEETLLYHHISCFDPDHPWVELEAPLNSIAGKYGQFILECDPGPLNDPRADHLAIYEFVISPREHMRLNRARAFMARRMRNESRYFTPVYEHAMYSSGSSAGEPAEYECGCSVSAESAYGYAIRSLNERSDTKPPDFAGRLKNKVFFQTKTITSKTRKLKILSLCCGAARVEEDFIRQLPQDSVELTITDINPRLLEIAKKRLGRLCKVNAIQCDINSLNTSETKYDIIMCVSALHHIVELEKLMEFVHSSLIDGGEFWIVQEYVGRNGNRLWPDAYEIANDFFKRLPDKYRLNKTAAAVPQLDCDLPNNDCSINVFEGIRSEDIENCLSNFFDPLFVQKHCCFLWRLFDLAYCDNYDMNNCADRRIVDDAIELELSHYYSGGRPTALNGIYKKK